MTRAIFLLAFLAGAAVLGWVGAGYVHVNAWALAMTAVIAAFYLAGTRELFHFGRDTDALANALRGLQSTPPALDPWLQTLPGSLRSAVRRRIEGERASLPGPAMTPALVGLLVLLGMLGTFLGMVATLKGTGLALDAAVDVQAVRAALSAPVKGLGFAFGTSVAGVAASAMLGLMSAMARRERLQAAQLLDQLLHSALRPHTATFREEEGLRLLRQQAESVPLLVDRLQAMMTAMERQAEALGARLSAQQRAFHDKTDAAYAGLAASVDRGLQRSLGEAARVAGAAIQPAVERAMTGLTQQAEATHEAVSRAVQQQLDTLSACVESMTAAVAGSLQASMSQQVQAHESLLQDLRASLDRYADASAQRIATLLASIAETQTTTQQQITERDRQRQAAWNDALQRTSQRDEAMHDERERLLQALQALLGSLQQSSSDQRASIDTLVASTTASLQSAAERFDTALQSGSSNIAQASAQVEAGALEVSALGEAFHHAVQLFGETSQRLGAQLQAIEQALDRSLARSDEQLEYCVAQAREVVDLTLMSQKQILEDLRQVAHQAAGRQAAEAEA
jgi:hypothetical protein